MAIDIKSWFVPTVILGICTFGTTVYFSGHNLGLSKRKDERERQIFVKDMQDKWNAAALQSENRERKNTIVLQLSSVQEDIRQLAQKIEVNRMALSSPDGNRRILAEDALRQNTMEMLHLEERELQLEEQLNEVSH